MNFKQGLLFTVLTYWGCVADAALIYNVEFVGQTAATPGSVVTVSAFFRETATAGESLLLRNPAWGLTTANFSIARTSSTGNNNITNVAKNTAAFDVNAPLTFTASSATLPLSAIANTPVGDSAAPNTSRLFLGSFDVTAGSVGSVASFALLQPLLNDFVLGDGAPNGPLSIGTSLGTLPSITISAVPEPSSILLVGIVGLLGFAARRAWR